MKELWTDGTNAIGTYEHGFTAYTKSVVPETNKKTGEKNEKAGDVRKMDETYHSTLYSAIRKVGTRVAKDEATNLKELIEKFAETSTAILNATKGL